MRRSSSPLTYLVLIACTAAGVAGCGGDDSGSSSTSGTSSSTTTAPSITTQPASITVTAGAAASFSVVATGSSTLTYQWSKDGTAISGATSATYSISATSESDAGSYTVTVTNSAGSVTSSAAVLTVNTAVASDCTVSTYSENVRCAVEAFAATLSSTQLASFEYTSDNSTSAQISVAKTQWSNLPVAMVQRSGISYGSLSTAQKTAFIAVARAALTDQGYKDFVDVIAADDYLATMTNGYGSDLYYIAVEGQPDASGLWMLQIGGHHLAFNISFSGGLAYPTPHHIGVEPKASFTVNGTSYQALAAKAGAMVAIFEGQTDSLSPSTSGSTALNSAKLSGSYGDVLVGPVEYATGSYSTVAAKYPTSDRGLLVSSLSAAQQDLVIAAMQEFVADYDSTTADRIVADYTSSAALAATYVAWTSPSGAYPNVDVNGTYMRIDGPRVWIEIACQNGVVVQGQTHYHMIYRDKEYDYFNELTSN